MRLKAIATPVVQIVLFALIPLSLTACEQATDTSGPTRWTDIFVKRNGKWQIAANHGSRVDEPQK